MYRISICCSLRARWPRQCFVPLSVAMASWPELLTLAASFAAYAFSVRVRPTARCTQGQMAAQPPTRCCSSWRLRHSGARQVRVDSAALAARGHGIAPASPGHDMCGAGGGALRSIYATSGSRRSARSCRRWSGRECGHNGNLVRAHVGLHLIAWLRIF